MGWATQDEDVAPRTGPTVRERAGEGAMTVREAPRAGPLSSLHLQRLQATAGNGAVAQLLGTHVVQRCGGERHEGCEECS